MGIELQPNEERLWKLVLNRYEDQPGEQLRIDPIANQLGVSSQHARQLVRTWKNRGWVDYSVSAERFYVLEAKPINSLSKEI